MNVTTEKQLLRVAEVAEMLDLGASTVWRQVRKGNLPAPIKIGDATRWRRSDIEALLHRVQAA